MFRCKAPLKLPVMTSVLSLFRPELKYMYRTLVTFSTLCLIIQLHSLLFLKRPYVTTIQVFTPVIVTQCFFPNVRDMTAWFTQAKGDSRQNSKVPSIRVVLEQALRKRKFA